MTIRQVLNRASRRSVQIQDHIPIWAICRLPWPQMMPRRKVGWEAQLSTAIIESRGVGGYEKVEKDI